MKLASIKKAITINEFLEKKIENPEFIVGGTNGPIDRDKLRKIVQRE